MVSAINELIWIEFLLIETELLARLVHFACYIFYSALPLMLWCGQQLQPFWPTHHRTFFFGRQRATMRWKFTNWICCQLPGWMVDANDFLSHIHLHRLPPPQGEINFCGRIRLVFRAGTHGTKSTSLRLWAFHIRCKFKWGTIPLTASQCVGGD